MSLIIDIKQADLVNVYEVQIKTALQTKFSKLKITFPADLNQLGIQMTQYTINNFTTLAD